MIAMQSPNIFKNISREGMFENVCMRSKSLDPCKIPNEKIKKKPNMISVFPEKMEVTHRPTKLNIIEKL